MKKYNPKEANKMLAAQLLADGLPEGPVCGGFSEDEIVEIRAMAVGLSKGKSIRATLKQITSSIRGLTWHTLRE